MDLFNNCFLDCIFSFPLKRSILSVYSAGETAKSFTWFRIRKISSFVFLSAKILPPHIYCLFVYQVDKMYSIWRLNLSGILSKKYTMCSVWLNHGNLLVIVTLCRTCLKLTLFRWNAVPHAHLYYQIFW